MEVPGNRFLFTKGKAGRNMANKEQKKVQKAAPKSNKQKKEMQKEKKAAKQAAGNSLKKE
jgi:hypothetical protein